MVNKLWELDLLQYKFQDLRPPRIKNTKKIVKSLRSDKVKEINISKQEAAARIKTLQLELFEERYQLFNLKLNQLLNKFITQATSNSILKDSDKLAYDQLLKKVKVIIQAKIIKISSKIYKNIIKDTEQKSEAFEKDVELVKTSKPYENNSKDVNNLISKLFNKAEVKKLIGKFEFRFKIILGRVEKPKSEIEVDKKDEAGEDEQDSDDELDNGDSEEIENKDEDGEDEEDAEIDPAQLYNAYKDVLAFSSDEELGGDEEDGISLDPKIDYNQITDEEPSAEEDNDIELPDSEYDEGDESEIDYEKTKAERNKLENDDFFTSDEPAAKRQKKEKFVLPALAGGYYSGGESDSELAEADDDDIVKAATKKERKNRRGQRARQKIWEMKFGSKAVHVQKEHERAKSEREQRQLEYEARVVKRAEKKRILEERQQRKDEKRGNRNANAEPVGELHPSWIAKKKQEEALKKLKFEGKKVKFD